MFWRLPCISRWSLGGHWFVFFLLISCHDSVISSLDTEVNRNVLKEKMSTQTKKWVLVHFKSDGAYMTVNTRDKNLAKRIRYEDGGVSVYFKDQGWCWGDILQQSGKVEIHEIFLPLSKYHCS